MRNPVRVPEVLEEKTDDLDVDKRAELLHLMRRTLDQGSADDIETSMQAPGNTDETINVLRSSSPPTGPGYLVCRQCQKKGTVNPAFFSQDRSPGITQRCPRCTFL